MKTWTVSVLGREVVKVVMREESTIADVVRHLVAQRLGVDEDEVDIDESGEERDYADLADGMIPCECCGEMFDPAETENDEVNLRFADMTERLIWGPSAVVEPDNEED